MMNNQFQYKKIKEVKANPNNPRIIKDHKYKSLLKSIKEFPKMLELRPIVVDKYMVVLGGNMRLRACMEAGLKEIPVIVAEQLTEKEQREFTIKDNVSFGEWDWEVLGNEWDPMDLDDWGLDIPTLMDSDLNGLFDDQAEIDNELPTGKIILQFPLDEVDRVKGELLKHGKTPEAAIYKLLGL